MRRVDGETPEERRLKIEDVNLSESTFLDAHSAR
jgi:hypothetical protein